MSCVGYGIRNKIQTLILVVVFLILKNANSVDGNINVENLSYMDNHIDPGDGNNINYDESPCNNELLSAFKNCVSLNPAVLNKKNVNTRYHSSLLYLADYLVEENGVILKEKVVLKRSVGLNTLKLNNTEEEGLSNIRIDESIETNTNYINIKVDKEEGETMKYLQEANYKYMPRLIDSNWNNTGWIVMGYYDGISLQEFYQGIYKDIDDIKIQNDHKFQDRMILKKGIIYKELQEYLDSKYENSLSNANNLYFNLLLSQYNSISYVYIELLKKGVIHCNMSPSSIMIKRGKLGIHPDEITILDYSNSIRWNTETSQVFFSDVKQSCVPDLRPILAFLLSDFNAYIPLSSLDVTFFGKISLAPINIVSTIEDSTYSGQCIDYNNLFRDYYNTHFNCRDLLIDYKIDNFNLINCNTPLPSNTALPYNFMVFHFCQKTCGICNKECESLVSIMNSDLYEETLMEDDLAVRSAGEKKNHNSSGGDEDDYDSVSEKEYRRNDNGERYISNGNNKAIDIYGNKSGSIIREKLIKKLFRACRTNYELLSGENLVNHWLNDLWVEEANSDASIERPETLLLGCKLCIKHQKILQSVLIHYDLPHILLYPNIDLFLGDVNILINSHQTIENLLKNYLLSLNVDIFKGMLSGNIMLNVDDENLDRNYHLLYKWKSTKYRNNVNSYLLIGDEFYNHNAKLSVMTEYENIPSGLLYYKMVEKEFMYINIKIVKQTFVSYMFKGFSSKYRERIIEMLRTYSLRLLPSSLKNFLIYC
ncbi:hypothetical protein FG379_001255 [Cryptosporidium bovis]|uniref:uncharacterized protein n=1 Tax=Cryptosporidium bovis TaxID=310047 RepID=UPI00351A071D|nr:hypothetical protein FG379_001255 [Cryptosporidium bovis]